MNRFMKLYNQNRYMVWIVVLTLIAIISLIQILNNFVDKNNSSKNTIKKNTTAATINKNYSVITGEEVENEASQIIDQFIDYCNNKQVESAYELLSSECKEVLYPTIGDFIKNYYSRIFSEKKSYLYQAWITHNNNYTYKVDFVEDMLATGKASNTSICDYYTVVKNNDTYELNINKFVGVKEINKTQEKDKIKISVNRKRIYIDYETYEIEVENNAKDEIILDSLQKAETVYLEDDNVQKYYWYNHEFLEEDVCVEKGENKEIEIKFNKEYNQKNEATKIVFSDIKIEDKVEIEVFL